MVIRPPSIDPTAARAKVRALIDIAKVIRPARAIGDEIPQHVLEPVPVEAYAPHVSRARGPVQNSTPKPTSAAELLRAAFPEIRWVIADILPEGIIIVAARPKIGKSWLALQFALGVASGGDVLNRRTTKGSVLYLALEDNPRRLQKRLRKYRAGYLADQTALTRIEFATDWRRADEGGIEDIAAWLDSHADARLVIIDTLERFRARRNERANAYAEDYAALQAMRALCIDRQITVLVVHHTRKAAADDPIDTISGTLGLGGAADAALVLQRPRGSEQAELHLIGRDIENEGTFAVTFDRATCRWQMEGVAAEVRISRERQQIIELLARRGSMKPASIAEELERKRATVRRLLRAMVDTGELDQDADGSYHIPIAYFARVGRASSRCSVQVVSTAAVFPRSVTFLP